MPLYRLPIQLFITEVAQFTRDEQERFERMER